MTHLQQLTIEDILTPYDYTLLEPSIDTSITPDIIMLLDTLEAELEAANQK